MSDLTFRVRDARPERHAAAPTLLLGLRVDAGDGRTIQALALRCQIRIEPQQRPYADGEVEGLRDLFGDRSRFGDTLKPFLWTHVSLVLPRFTGAVDVDLPVACTYDLEVAAGKYLDALAGGDVPLRLLFSGTVFAEVAGALQATPVPWHAEATYRLPVAVWREMIALHFPETGWIRLQRDTLRALARFKARHALPTFDGVMQALLDHSEEPPR